MNYIHPHNIGKTLGVIHEDKPDLQPIDVVRSGIPPQRPTTYLLDPTGPFFSQEALMQGLSPECGGYSLATLIQFSKAFNQSLSGSFCYSYEKTIDGVPNEEGTIISAVGKTGNVVGSCLETDFPDDGKLDVNSLATISTWSEANPIAIQDAATRLLGQPFLLTDLSIDGIHQACYENAAVILEVRVGAEWYTGTDGVETWEASKILPIRPPGTIIDSHFICVAPYDEPNDRTWFLNTWSNEWGQNGFGYFQSNYAPYIVNGIAFKVIPPSVQQALSANQVTLAQQILQDMAKVLTLIQKEI